MSRCRGEARKSRDGSAVVRSWIAVTAGLLTLLSPMIAGPAPEPINLLELPLPPAAPSAEPGSCSYRINPHGTGCISASEFGMVEGPSYMWDGHHVLMTVFFVGAPAAPKSASAYSGLQVIAVKTDGSHFPNGDAWKCLTCGVPAANAVGINRRVPDFSIGQPAGPQPVFDHPQAFRDDKRVLAGMNILDCGTYRVTDAACTPQRLHIYPIRWGRSADGLGEGSNMREQRLHPDNVHMGWGSFAPPNRFDEFGFFGRLVFNPAPKTGLPLAPRYDIENVSVLANSAQQYAMFMPDPEHPGYLLHNAPRGVIGEFRGFSSDGKSTLGIFLEESGNVDLYRTDMQTGASTRLTRDPSYTDPSKMSPDDRWVVYYNPRQSDRHMYYAGLQGIPPLMDILTLSVDACCYNNGNRRFFQPYLLATDDTREDYPGQQLNAGPGIPGSASDPNWNARADPAWSPDGTHVVFWQAIVTAPACGDVHPVPCPESTEPGGRRTRLMMATLTGRKPIAREPADPVSDAVPWAIALPPGDPLPVHSRIQPGKFILKGRASGQADVEIREAGGAITFVSARYKNYSDDGRHIINGTESAERGAIPGQVVWHSNIQASGAQQGTKVTSEPDGFVTSWKGAVSGMLTTTIDGKVYTPPLKGS